MARKYDKQYKKLFSNPLLVEELLRFFVHERFVDELDYSTLERLDKSFVTDQFKEKESDLIYKIKFRGTDLYIFLLIEFQSTVDNYMAVRMCRYEMEFYEFLVQNKEDEQLPAVFPLLVYNGDNAWTAKQNVRELIRKSIPSKYIPSFSYYKIAINEIPKKTLLTIHNTVSAIFFVENSSPEELRTELRRVLKLLEKEHPAVIRLWRLWFNNALGNKDNKLMEQVDNLQEVKAMFETRLKKSLEEQYEKGTEHGFEKGTEHGFEKGTEYGFEKGTIAIAENMIREGMDNKQIRIITGLSMKKIEALRKKCVGNAKK